MHYMQLLTKKGIIIQDALVLEKVVSILPAIFWQQQIG